jgi:hypothetical protein
MENIKIDLHDSDNTHRTTSYNGFSKNPSHISANSITRIPHNLPLINDHSHSVNSHSANSHSVNSHSSHLHKTPLHGTSLLDKKSKILYTNHDPVEVIEEEKEVLCENLVTEKEHVLLHSHLTKPVNENNDTPSPKEKVIWRSCCFQLDPKGVAYAGQFTISMTVLGISTYMLLKADGDCNQSSPYIGLISFLLGKILSTVVSSA